ncbi:MAG TPA: hypothetical protein VHM19_07260, partial [Polyangiales bacterium]|nr:hypothetical protein [Polyangiales bacterium]
DAQKHGAQVVGLVTERLAPDVARKAAQELGMSYTIGLSDEHLLQRFQVHTIPTTYVLAPDGAIVLSRVGKLDATELDEALARAGLGAGRATKI